MNVFRKRLASGMGAYTYAQLVTILTQILGLPLFLIFWDLQTYGEWLILSAVPTYFSLVDLGVVAVAGNRMTMASANDDFQLANKVFQNALFMTFSMCIIFTILVGLSIFLIDFSFLEKKGYKIAFFLLFMASLFSLWGRLYESIFKANHQYAKGTYLITTARLTDWMGSIIAISIFETILSAATGYFISRALMTISSIIYTSKKFNKFHWSLMGADLETLKGLLKPSLAFMAFPVSSALIIQGMTIIVGSSIGPVAVVIFNTYRTLSRFLLQGVSIISKPLLPEFSRFYGIGDTSKIKKIFRFGTALSFAFMLLGGGFLSIFGPVIIEYWTDNKVQFIPDVFYLLVLTSMISGVYQIPLTILSATNKHVEFFICALIIALLTVVLSFSYTYQYGLVGITTSLVVYELIVLVLCFIFLQKNIFSTNLTTYKGQVNEL